MLTPPSRDGAGATYDAARGVVVVFGGRHYGDNGFSSILDDTWTWDGTTWTEQQPATKPPPRQFTVMAYDAALGKAVLFGGQSSTGPGLNDTWTWDGVNWTRVTTANSPPGRLAASLAYDEPRQKLVLFGGFSFPVYLGDTWLFDGTDWTLALPALSPTPRYGSNSLMTYVPANQGLVLFGGSDALGSKNDTWLWNGTTWAPLFPASSPPARFSQAITYDSANARAILYIFGVSSGGHGETWTWDGQNWQRADVASPVSRFGEVFVYHAGVARVLLYSGALCVGPGVTPRDEWLWDGSSWQRVDLGEKSPSLRHYIQGQMAFDSDRRQTVLFGGENGCQILNDTWTWNGAAWAQVFPAVSPIVRLDASMAYDPVRRLVVLFGGRSDVGYLNDTWVFDGAAWTRRNPATSPPARIAAVMAFDAVSGKVVLFSGRSPATTLTDTWSWDGSNWTQETPTTNAPGRVAASMSHDAQGRPVLFGGIDVVTGVEYADTWRWNGASRNWEAVATAGATPPARNAAGMGYDARSASIILFGGTNRADIIFGDTWAFDGGNWQQLSPATSPSPRAFFGIADGSLTHPPTLMGGSFPYVTGPGSAESWTWGSPTPQVRLLTTASRKMHGGVGPFDIDLPLTGAPGIECRSGGASGDHTLVFSFANPLTNVGGATVSSGTGSVSSSAIESGDARNYIVNLTGVTNAQTITVSLANVNDSAGNSSASVSVPMGILLGDTSADRVVNSADITETRRQSGEVATAGPPPNFRTDLSTDGVINSADITLVRRASGTALP